MRRMYQTLRRDARRTKSDAPRDFALERSLALVCRGLFSAPNALLSIGRFQLVRTLGRGGTGIVYEGIDPIRREHVALKVLHGRGPTQLFRLKREFRALAGLSHPNLVALHELSIESGEAFISMDLVNGRDFVSYARTSATAPNEPNSEDSRLRSALGQLCEGVHALHCAGKLHRDLKPTNILVSDAGHVVLLDFGLVEDAHAGHREREGTPGYMAPEQMHGRASEASDWYAFGRVLQESLRAGRRERDRAATSAQSSAGRAALERLARRLLDPDPTRRPGYAEISSVVHGIPAARGPQGSRVRHDAPFIGREAELVRLADAYTRSRAGPVMVLVRGEPGIGKSTLLRRFTSDRLEPSGALILSGRCYAGESVPYKALDSVIDALSMHLVKISPERARSLRPSDSAPLLHVFPVLGRVPWLHEAATRLEGVHPVELRARAFAALRELLAGLASDRPLVLHIDDLQWSDADSGRLLGALLCDEAAPAVLVVATDRTGPRLTRDTLDELRGASDLSPYPLAIDQLELGPLSTQDAEKLARALLEGASENRVNEVAAESHGNPLFLTELSHWVADLRAEQAGELPKLEALFAERMRPLSTAGRDLLAWIALAGRPLPLAVLGRAAQRDSELFAQLKELRRARLVQALRRGTDDLIEIAHDRLANAVLRDVGAHDQETRHVQLARAFEAELGVGCEPPIEHYLAANMPREAAARARNAAQLALSTLAFARAAELYQQALRLGDWGDAERAEILREYGRALEHDGRGLAAARAYARAAKLAIEPHDAAQLHQRAAEQLMHNGRFRSGEALLRRGYAALGIPWPRGRLALFFAILWRLLPLRLRQLMTTGDGATEPRRRARAQLLLSAARGLENYDLLRAVHNALVCFDESGQLTDPVWRVRAKGARALMRSFSLMPGGRVRGLAELIEACDAAAALGGGAAQVDLLRQLATVHYFSGRPREALEAAQRSEQRLRALPHNPTELFPITGIAGAALVDLGELRKARLLWAGNAREARIHSDLLTNTYVHAHPLRLAPLFAAEDHAQIQQVLDLQARLRTRYPRYRLLAWANALCRVERALYFDSGNEALRVARDDEQALLRSGYPLLTAAARMTLARVGVAAASALPPSAARARLLRGAARDAAAVRKRGSAVQRGKALLVEAGIHRLREQRELALTKLDMALALFERAEAKLLVECARSCRSYLCDERGDALTSEAERALSAEDVKNPARWMNWAACGFRLEPRNLKS